MPQLGQNFWPAASLAWQLGALRQRGTAEEIQVFGVVLRAGFGMDLLAGGQSLLGPQLLLLVGGAVFAKAGVGVPAHVGADPMAAARALLEVLLAFGPGRFQG